MKVHGPDSSTVVLPKGWSSLRCIASLKTILARLSNILVCTTCQLSHACSRAQHPESMAEGMLQALGGVAVIPCHIVGWLGDRHTIATGYLCVIIGLLSPSPMASNMSSTSGGSSANPSHHKSQLVWLRGGLIRPLLILWFQCYSSNPGGREFDGADHRHQRSDYQKAPERRRFPPAVRPCGGPPTWR